MIKIHIVIPGCDESQCGRSGPQYKFTYHPEDTTCKICLKTIHKISGEWWADCGKWTTSCSGCFESEDGHPVGYYPIDPKHGCYVGAGCHECGYTGKRIQRGGVHMEWLNEKFYKNKRTPNQEV